MKRILLIAGLLFTAIAYAQNTDSLIGLIYKEQTDSARIRRLYYVMDTYGSMDPVKAIEVQQQLLALTKQKKDRVAEAVVTSELGYLFQLGGNTVQAKHLELEALKMAEATGSAQAIGIAYQNLATFSPDPIKFKQLNEKALYYSTLAGDNYFICVELYNMGNFYVRDSVQLDSALYYAEKGYRLAIAKKQEYPLIMLSLVLSKIHQKLGNNGLALEYIRAADRLPITQENNQFRSWVYRYYTDYYLAVGPADSAFFYAYKNLDVASRSYILYMKGPTDALRRLYAGRNNDSALKYTNLYLAVTDSIATSKEQQQVQAMAFEEDMRQEKLEAEKRKAAEDREHNLQYAAIAIGLVLFVILFFLFSHSIVANPKVIKFFGILSLLIVFEFVNLLIHPYLGGLTHHSPVMMLGFMVCLAAMLIPIHHKLEHWITHKMVEKNNRIRLAAAKKTIEQLEGAQSKVEQH